MLTAIIWIIIALVAYAFREELMAIAAFVGICMGIGALIFWIVFDNAGLGATVGFWFAVSQASGGTTIIITGNTVCLIGRTAIIILGESDLSMYSTSGQVWLNI